MSATAPHLHLSSVASAEDLLNSWKEIATYLNRGVRTVQRWEAELGLPVRRLSGKGRSSVIAMRSDLDQWLRSCSISAQSSPRPQMNNLAELRGPILQQGGISDLVMRSRSLQHDMAHTRAEFKGALERLIESLQRMVQPGPGDNRPQAG